MILFLTIVSAIITAQVLLGIVGFLAWRAMFHSIMNETIESFASADNATT